MATLALLSLLAIGLIPAESRAASGRFRVLYAEPVTIQGLASHPVRASFDAYGRRFDLVLESNERLLAGLGEADRSAISGVRLLRGSLAGVPSSWVRLAIDGDRQSGMVWDGRDLYVIEPAIEVARRAVNPLGVGGRKPVVYRLSDTQSDPGAATCEVVLPDRSTAKASGLDEYRALVGSLKQAAQASDLAGRLQVSAIADYEFYQYAGSAEAARSRIAAIFNDVDGIYGAQVGIQIELADAITVFQDPADPFTSSDASALLEELGDHRRSQSSLSATGVTHLVTGRDLTGSTVGIAYIAALCLSSYGASLSQGTASLVALIAAHEIGHNFGAPHDGEAAESGQPANPCEATPRTFLMAPQLNGSDQFSQCSLTQMQPEIDAASCILPLTATADLALSTTATSVSTSTGQPFALRASVASRGTADATSARLMFVVPSGLAVVDGTATSGGTCATQAGGIACTWPSLVAGMTSSTTLNLRADVAGSYAVAATLVAAEDASVGNDALEFRVTATAPGTVPPPASAGNGGGGGGALGRFGLAGLLVLLAARSGRSRRAIRTGSR
ncbi:MAG: M12 family metallo-peptidase [Steroidobacteraceae bacterium]